MSQYTRQGSSLDGEIVDAIDDYDGEGRYADEEEEDDDPEGMARGDSFDDDGDDDDDDDGDEAEEDEQKVSGLDPLEACEPG